MIIFLHGKDTYRSKAQLRKMVTKFQQDRDPQGLNFSRIDVVVGGTKGLLEQLLAAPFLAEKRMVVVERLLQHGDDDLCADVLARVEQERCPSDVVWVFWEEQTPKKKMAKQLYAALEKLQFAQLFDLPEGKGMLGWIAKEAQEYGKHIDQQAAAEIARTAGGDSWYAATVIQSASAHAKSEHIELADVRPFVQEQPDDNIFGLLDAVLAGRIQQALRAFHGQIVLGKDAHFVFQMIIRQVQMLLDARDALDREMDVPTMQKVFDGHPFAIKKAAEAAKRFTFDQLREMHSRLIGIDFDAKTGGASYQEGIEQLMYQANKKEGN